MRSSAHRLAGLGLVISGLALPVAAQEKPLPPPDRAPHLILAHNGPHAPVTALAFAPDAGTLYVGGFDKQVRRYELVKGKYVAAESIRVPIGPGNAGVVNALAVSPDGKWVAAAGRAPIRGEAWGAADDGVSEDLRHIPPLLRRDSGVVYLFDPAKPDGGKVIRGPRSGVRAVAFANPAPANGPVLVTAGIEWDDDAGKESGVVRAFDVTTGEERGFQRGLPTTEIPPGLAAWAVGPDNKVRVAVSWEKANWKDGGELLVWDIGGKVEKVPDTFFNAPLAVRVGKGGATEVISGGVELNGAKKNAGRLAVRSADPVGKPERLWLSGEAGATLGPLAVAPLTMKDIGDAIAVLAEVDPRPVGAAGRPTQLLLVGPRGGVIGKPISLVGVSDQSLPVLAASPDGRFVAVAGFTDNRVEVYNAAALAAGEPVVEQLKGGERGFSKVAFLVGEKLWLGGAGDTPEKGGVVLDLDRAVRAAAPPAAKDAIKVDAPAAGAAPKLLEADAAKKLPWRVVVAVGGAEKTVALPDGERATAAALLPGKPAWDATLGPVVAVAHVHDRSQTVLVTLYDAATAKPLFRLGGPTLPVRALAFSGTRPLLAAAGDDGTVAVWSMKNVARTLPTIEGLLVTARGGEVVVVAVQPDGPANGKLKVDDVIESVADATGVQKPVTTPIDFLLAVRALKVGDDAQVKVKGRAAVAVAVGTAIGGRHPLFTLWVDPVPKGGKHDWVGWTTSGPYDANGEAAEGRIGWLTSTGDPARPVTFAGANQYRKLFYKRDFIRRLVETADHRLADQMPPPRPAALVVTLPAGAKLGDGPLVVRETLDGLEVSLNDPDSVLDLDRAELRWQITGPAGGASALARVPFSSGRAGLDLSKHAWTRGEHRVHVTLFKSPSDEVPLLEVTFVVWFRPPAPVLTVKIDKVPAAGVEITTENDEVEVTATADAKANPDGAAVTLSWTDGGKPVVLTRKPDGTYGPAKVTLKAQGTTAILVTATNLGEGVKAADESHAIEVRVRKLVKIVPPTVKLLVLTPFDFRTATNEPYVVSTETATLTATVECATPLAAFEWKVGTAEWVVGKLDEKTKSATRELALPANGAPLVVEVRAKAVNGASATDSATISYQEIPAVSVTLPPAQVTAPELNLTGGLKVLGKRPFKVRVLVTSSRTGRTREFDSAVNAARTQWEAGVTLFPGENTLGYVVLYDNDRKELRREGLIDVRYVRPPLVAGGAPVDVGTGTVGDLALAVVSTADAPPSELSVNGARVGFRTHAKPIPLFGAKLWVLTARGVPVPAGADRLKPVAVAVRNAEGESRPVAVAVLGRVEVKVPPPEIRLTRDTGIIAHDQEVPAVGDGRFTFDLRVISESPLTRVEVWYGKSADIGTLQDGVKAAGAVPAPGGGFELTARPVLNLRPGTENHVRVVASSAGGTATVAFKVSFTPPPVQVVIDSINEPKGEPIAVMSGSAAELKVAGYVIEVEGRVIWYTDDLPVAKDQNLTVVFSANGVAHLPVTVPLPKEGKERKFSGRVYLNASGNPDPKVPAVTHVRADLRSGNRPVPLAQVGSKSAEFFVTSAAPLRDQRFHVLMLGVEVPEADRKPLVHSLVKAVGGTIPADNPNFTEGRFTHPRFSFAYLYSPRLGYTKGGDLNALLNAVRADIERRSKRQGEEWLNDVVVVYYQGGDWAEPDGRRYLHSATTLSGAAGKNRADYAIRMDNLPQTHGLLVALVNVAGDAETSGTLVIDIPYVRYAWENAANLAQILVQFAEAVKAERELRPILAAVNAGLSKAAIALVGKPDPSKVPDDVAKRELGGTNAKPMP